MKYIALFCSFVVSSVLLLLYAGLLALATWEEREMGTEYAKELIYMNPAFIALQAVMALQMLAALIHGAYWRKRRFGMLMTHLSIILILAGALVTHLTGREGTMSLREGESSSIMTLRSDSPQKEKECVSLPFTVELKDFVLERYAGSSSPSSFESHIVLHHEGTSKAERIYMNNTLDVAGYRLFQLNYFPDESGTVLLLNQDVLGRRITYTGYALLGLGLLLSLLSRQGRVAQIMRQLSRVGCFLFLLAASIPQLHALQDATALDLAVKYAVPQKEAAAFAALPMQDTRGRLAPVNTFASELLRKLSREESIGGLDANQFLLGLWIVPDLWVRVPLIQIKPLGIAEKYALPQGKLALLDLINEDGSYKLSEELESIYTKEKNELSSYDKELLKLDEKVNLLHMVVNRQMVKLFPDEQDDYHRWYAPGDDMSHFEEDAAAFTSKITDWYLMELVAAMKGEKPWSEPQRVRDFIETYQYAKGQGAGLDADKIKAELFYNESRLFARCKTAYLILGGISLLLAFLSFACKGAWLRCLRYVVGAGVVLSFLAQSGGMGLRWYIASYAPWSNSYETMVYVAWIMVFIGLLLARRSAFVFSLSVLFAGIILFVSGLSWLDPQISPLVPVLKSAWLMFHVAVIVASYGFFGIAFLLALVNMLLMVVTGRREKPLLRKSIEELSLIQELLLHFGLALMVVGTFLGAIWANESWGRYWGWDPKETWALITIVCYTLVTHLRLIKGLQGIFYFNFASLLAFFSVLMTYFGVNYFLSGMHSYSSMSINEIVIAYILISVSLLLLLSLLAGLRFALCHKKRN